MKVKDIPARVSENAGTLKISSARCNRGDESIYSVETGNRVIYMQRAPLETRLREIALLLALKSPNPPGRHCAAIESSCYYFLST